MSDNTSPTALDLATTEDLVSELRRRFDTGFMFLRRDTQPGIENRAIFTVGDVYACLGMADQLHQEIRDRVLLVNEFDYDEGGAAEIDDELGDD